jgi:hypothetical protein
VLLNEGHRHRRSAVMYAPLEGKSVLLLDVLLDLRRLRVDELALRMLQPTVGPQRWKGPATTAARRLLLLFLGRGAITAATTGNSYWHQLAWLRK